MAGSSWTNQVQNTVIVAGTKPGVFVYSGVPGPGNIPIAWMSNSTTDPFGNTLPSPGGVGSYDGISAWSQLATGLVLLGNSGVVLPARLQLDPVADMLEIRSHKLNSGDTIAELDLHPSATAQPYAALTGFLEISKVTPPASAGTALWTNANGTPSLQTAAGFAGQPPAEQTDTANHTNNGSTSAAVAISAAWTVPAGDMQNGTVYVLEVPYTGIQEGQTVTWGISVDGGTPVAQDGIGAAFFSAGGNFVGTVRGRVHVAGTGTAAPVLFYLDGGVGLSGIRSSGANNNDSYLSGIGTGGTINTTVSHTFAITAQFGGISAGQTVVGYGSIFSRKGP